MGKEYKVLLVATVHARGESISLKNEEQAYGRYL